MKRSAKVRLMTLRKSSDGFEIAREDLKIRGPGEVMGSRQTGMLEFRIADLQRDQDLFMAVQQFGNMIAEQHPELVQPLMSRWIGSGVRCAVV